VSRGVPFRVGANVTGVMNGALIGVALGVTDGVLLGVANGLPVGETTVTGAATGEPLSFSRVSNKLGLTDGEALGDIEGDGGGKKTGYGS
jgi:hypothetical protein